MTGSNDSYPVWEEAMEHLIPTSGWCVTRGMQFMFWTSTPFQVNWAPLCAMLLLASFHAGVRGINPILCKLSIAMHTIWLQATNLHFGYWRPHGYYMILLIFEGFRIRFTSPWAVDAYSNFHRCALSLSWRVLLVIQCQNVVWMHSNLVGEYGTTVMLIEDQRFCKWIRFGTAAEDFIFIVKLQGLIAFFGIVYIYNIFDLWRILEGNTEGERSPQGAISTAFSLILVVSLILCNASCWHSNMDEWDEITDIWGQLHLVH